MIEIPIEFYHNKRKILKCFTPLRETKVFLDKESDEEQYHVSNVKDKNVETVMRENKV